MLSSWWIDNVLLDAPCGQQQMFTDGQNQKGQFVVHQTIILDVPCGHAAADVPRRPVLAQDLSVPVQRETPLHQEPVRPQKNAERPNDTLYCVLCCVHTAMQDNNGKCFLYLTRCSFAIPPPPPPRCLRSAAPCSVMSHATAGATSPPPRRLLPRRRRAPIFDTAGFVYKSIVG